MSQKNRTLIPPAPPEKSRPKGKFRKSGHLVDEQLKYSYPKDGNSQLSLFSQLLPDTIKTIALYPEVEAENIVEGIRLTPAEDRVVDCLCKLLDKKSQNVDPKKDNYFAGNAEARIVNNYGEEPALAPGLAFTLYELTKEYKGGEAIGGKDTANVMSILTTLDTRKYLIRHTEKRFNKTTKAWKRREIEGFQKLIDILKVTDTTGQGDREHSKETDFIILLNPIFRGQIDSKFILYPNDIHKRTMIAYGSWNISDIAKRLREYLVREISSKHYSPEIYLDRLYYMVAEKWMKESRKGKVKEYLQKAIETCEALGIIESYETKTGATGAPLMVFTLNKNWE
jgi:hypothetical protein